MGNMSKMNMINTISILNMWSTDCNRRFSRGEHEGHADLDAHDGYFRMMMILYDILLMMSMMTDIKHMIDITIFPPHPPIPFCHHSVCTLAPFSISAVQIFIRLSGRG